MIEVQFDRETFLVPDSVYQEIIRLAQNNSICLLCGKQSDLDNPIVASNECLKCFLRSNKEYMEFTYLGMNTIAPEVGNFYLFLSHEEIYTSYPHSVWRGYFDISPYITLRYWGYHLPDTHRLYKKKWGDAANWDLNYYDSPHNLETIIIGIYGEDSEEETFFLISPYEPCVKLTQKQKKDLLYRACNETQLEWSEDTKRSILECVAKLASQILNHH